MKVMTYGEAHIFVLLSNWVVKGNTTLSVPLPPHNPRMKEDEALKYYGSKLKLVFEDSGYIKKEIQKSDFEIRFPILLSEVQVKTKAMIKREVRKNNKLLLRM